MRRFTRAFRLFVQGEVSRFVGQASKPEINQKETFLHLRVMTRQISKKEIL
jgi:hypothetical protein